jgi:hypothetical protein
MRKYRLSLLSALALTALPCTAVEAAGPFSGPYAAIALGQKTVNFSQSFEQTAPPPFVLAQDMGRSSLMGQLSGGYDFPVYKDLRVGLGAFWDFGDSRTGDIKIAYPGFDARTSARQVKHYGLSLEPGIVLNKIALAYFKLTLNYAQILQDDPGVNFGTPFSANERFHRFGYGLGLKCLVYRQIYLYAEWQYINYGSNTLDIPSGREIDTLRNTLGLFGVGYHF